MKKVLFIILALIIIGFSSYYAFVYYASFSNGVRAGQLVKFSKKGIGFKTWEGQISIEATQPIWNFSVQDNLPEVIKKLQELQGENVKLTYIERYKTFPWLGETKYFVTNVEQTNVNVANIKEPENKPNNAELEELRQENKELKETILDLKERVSELKTTIKVLQNQ